MLKSIGLCSFGLLFLLSLIYQVRVFVCFITFPVTYNSLRTEKVLDLITLMKQVISQSTFPYSFHSWKRILGICEGRKECKGDRCQNHFSFTDWMCYHDARHLKRRLFWKHSVFNFPYSSCLREEPKKQENIVIHLFLLIPKFQQPEPQTDYNF